MELRTAQRRRMVAPVEVFIGRNVLYGYGDSHLSIRTTADGTFIIKFKWNEWSLTSLQMDMFDLWFKVSTRFSVKFTAECVEVGPWNVTDECLKYESNKIDYITHRVRVCTGRYFEIRYYDKDRLHCYTLNHDDIRVLIALTMTMHGSQYLY